MNGFSQKKPRISFVEIRGTVFYLSPTRSYPNHEGMRIRHNSGRSSDFPALLAAFPFQNETVANEG